MQLHAPGIILCLILVTGCSIAPSFGGRTALPAHQPPPKVELVVQELQKALATPHEKSYWGLIALNPAVDDLVEDQRAKDNALASIPLKEALTDFNFSQEVITAAEAALGSDSHITVLSAALVEGQVINPHLPTTAKGQEAEAKLIITPYYSLYDDFRYVRVSFHTTITSFAEKPTAEALEWGLVPSIYQNTFTAIVRLPFQNEDMNANAALLAENGGATLKQAFLTAIRENARMLAYDLAISQDAETEAEGFMTIKKVGPDHYRGRIIASENDRLWIRASGGSIYSVPTTSEGTADPEEDLVAR